MSLSVTAWRLIDPAGTLAQCLINERDGRWHLVVCRGHEVIFGERCATDEGALARANEIWSVLIEHGWTELRH
jgi:hypothetical protein